MKQVICHYFALYHPPILIKGKAIGCSVGWLLSEWLVMPLVGKSQHLLVTPAVAESLDVVSGSVEAEGGGSLAVLYCLGKGFANAMHFLFSITIIGLEPTGHLAIDNFYLGAQYLDAV